MTSTRMASVSRTGSAAEEVPKAVVATAGALGDEQRELLVRVGGAACTRALVDDPAVAAAAAVQRLGADVGEPGLLEELLGLGHRLAADVGHRAGLVALRHVHRDLRALLR